MNHLKEIIQLQSIKITCKALQLSFSEVMKGFSLKLMKDAFKRNNMAAWKTRKRRTFHLRAVKLVMFGTEIPLGLKDLEDRRKPDKKPTITSSLYVTRKWKLEA